MTRFTVLPNPDAVAEATADRFVAVTARAIDDRGIARVALSGGGTPKQVYPLILQPPRREIVEWSRVEFFWGDERSVPPDHPESNFGVAYGMLLSQLPDVRADRIHRMPAEVDDLDRAALSYESELRLAFRTHAGELPRFDLIWLGMGHDGHTASLFPGAPAAEEDERWVVGTDAGPQPHPRRMTLTLPVLNAGGHVLVAVTGGDKADALARVRDGDLSLPAAQVQGEQVEWLVDAAAAGER